MKKAPINIDYYYKNEFEQTIEFWLILPDGISYLELKPNQIHRLPTGEELGYFVLYKNDEIHLKYTTDWYVPNNDKKKLSNEEKKYYLRDTVLSPVNKRTLEFALNITKNADSKSDQAKAIFNYIVNNYKYKYPPKSRGAKSFLRQKKGDCAEFSFLFSSLCRSLSIPTRTLFGSWSFGKMNGHAWNEYFLEEEGWIAVDVSMARLQKFNFFKFFFSDIRTLWWKKYFGKTEGQRIIFSKDAEIELLPRYSDNKDKSRVIEPLLINEDKFYWGQESLNGTAPYLQPSYLRIDVDKVDSDIPIEVDNLLGSWEIKEIGFRGILARLKKYLAFSAFITLGINSLFYNDYLELIFKFSFISLFLCFVLRGERVILFSIFLVLMVLSLLSTVSILI